MFLVFPGINQKNKLPENYFDILNQKLLYNYSFDKFLYSSMDYRNFLDFTILNNSNQRYLTAGYFQKIAYRDFLIKEIFFIYTFFMIMLNALPKKYHEKHFFFVLESGYIHIPTDSGATFQKTNISIN